MFKKVRYCELLKNKFVNIKFTNLQTFIIYLIC